MRVHSPSATQRCPWWQVCAIPHFPSISLYIRVLCILSLWYTELTTASSCDVCHLDVVNGIIYAFGMTYNRRHIQHFTRRIISTYSAATESELVEGTSWYDDARRFCEETAETYGVTLQTVAGIVAVLSPMTEWELNKQRALMILDGANSGMLNASKACAIRDGVNPEDVVSGQKVIAFYRAILGNYHSVVIDRHAHDVAIGRKCSDTERKVLERANQFPLFVEAYERASERLGVAPVIVQAVTWTVMRRRESRFAAARSREAGVNRLRLAA